MEVLVKETSEGDMYIDIPSKLINDLGWEDGDDVRFIYREGDSSFKVERVDPEESCTSKENQP